VKAQRMHYKNDFCMRTNHHLLKIPRCRARLLLTTMTHLTKYNVAKLWLNTAAVKLYFSQTVKFSNTIISHNYITISLIIVYSK